MIKFLKTTKWWMYIPFACISFPFFDWIFDGFNRKERNKRMILYTINLLWTVIFMSTLFLFIIIR